MKVSEYISEFMAFLKKSKQDYQWNCQDQSMAEQDTQDILHELELNRDNLNEMDIIKLGYACGETRNRRRTAKNNVEVLQPIIDFLEANPGILRQLEELLGKVRKIEKRQINRTYIPRGDIVKNTLEGADEVGTGECEIEATP